MSDSLITRFKMRRNPISAAVAIALHAPGFERVRGHACVHMAIAALASERPA